VGGKQSPRSRLHHKSGVRQGCVVACTRSPAPAVFCRAGDFHYGARQSHRQHQSSGNNLLTDVDFVILLVKQAAQYAEAAIAMASHVCSDFQQ